MFPHRALYVWCTSGCGWWRPPGGVAGPHCILSGRAGCAGVADADDRSAHAPAPDPGRQLQALAAEAERLRTAQSHEQVNVAQDG